MPPKRKNMTNTLNDLRPMPRKKHQSSRSDSREVDTSQSRERITRLRRDHRFSPPTSFQQELQNVLPELSQSESSDSLTRLRRDHRFSPPTSFQQELQNVLPELSQSESSDPLTRLRRDHRFSPSTSSQQELQNALLEPRRSLIASTFLQQDSSDARQQPREDNTPHQGELQRIRKSLEEFKVQIHPFLTYEKVNNELVESALKEIEALVEQTGRSDFDKLRNIYNNILNTVFNLETSSKYYHIEDACRDFALKLKEGYQRHNASSSTEQTLSISHTFKNLPIHLSSLSKERSPLTDNAVHLWESTLRIHNTSWYVSISSRLYRIKPLIRKLTQKLE